jgi:photosynthetic reaction center H subunit
MTAAMSPVRAGDPREPVGNPLLSGLGPAAYADRADRPDLTFHGLPRIVPMSLAPEFTIEARDPDPRGLPVAGADGAMAGVVIDVWVDRSEPQVRYLEVRVEPSGSRVLLPITYAKVHRSRGQIKVKAITAVQFADVPKTAQTGVVTLLEEDKIQAYFAGGHLYATPERLGPVL